MCRISKQSNSPVVTHPSWEGVPVYKLPVNQRRGFLNDCLAHWIPTVNHLVNVFQFSGERPRFFDISVVLRLSVRQHFLIHCSLTEFSRTLCVKTQQQSFPFLTVEKRKCTSGPIQPLNVSPLVQKCFVRGSLIMSVFGNLLKVSHKPCREN